MNRAADVRRVTSSLVAQFGESHLVPSLIRLLASGKPVSAQQIAAKSGFGLVEVNKELARHPSVERNSTGTIVGFGLTLRPTEHKFTFQGRTVFGWCATDTLVFPVLLNAPGIVESVCPVTRRGIRVSVTPTGVESVDPPEAVVSEVRPTERVTDLRSDICSLGLFFSSREVAEPWFQQYPQGQLNTVEYDFDIHRQAVEDLGWLN